MGLVLSRKLEEGTILTKGDERIEVRVVRIGPGNVRLDFIADRSWLIVREELTRYTDTQKPKEPA